MKLIEPVVASVEKFQRIRRDLHAHPEIQYEEHRTSDVVARALADWGIEVHRGLGGTGVVGTIRAGSGSRAIALRADMDALPLSELNTFEHRSVNAGRMHACGHDGHTTMLLAAAKHLAETRAFDGVVHLVFQPAEEGGGAGARAMIEDGLFERFPCEAVFGMHNWPGMPVGEFGVRSGAMLAATCQFEITVHGRGGHAAMPHSTIDPIAVAAQIHAGLQTIIARNKKPIDGGVLSVTQFNAGSAVNIIPDEAVLKGTIRAFSMGVLEMIESRMQQVATLVAQAHGASATVTLSRGYPPTVNHPRETAVCVDVMREIAGDACVNDELEPTMGAEDFAFMLQAKPGCYVFIGNGEGGHRDPGHGEGPCLLHNPSYDFNDDLIPLGATYWVRLVERWLR